MLISDVEFHDEAAAEYDAAFDWYMQRSSDSALRFDSEVAKAITQISQSPKRWAAGSHGTRRFLLRQFPFILIYCERQAGDILIVAVAHASRKPGFWKTRL
jgi:toxin ParE1/3/4